VAQPGRRAGRTTTRWRWLPSFTAGHEKFVIGVELLQMPEAFMQGVTVDTTTLALDAIDEVGPGGHHFGSAHTTERYRSEFYRPLISDWHTVTGLR
jgi:trimethylamine--corrinoid protein Co-methyltransferase